MTSAKLGADNSEIEVTNISMHGFWILIDDKERLLPFEHFPWFRGASVRDICELELLGKDHLYWPALDIDLSVESIDNPERFPLVSKAMPE